jgi:hypothetical protein
VKPVQVVEEDITEEEEVAMAGALQVVVEVARHGPRLQ